MREYRTTRTTIVETIPPLPPARKASRNRTTVPAAFKAGDRVMIVLQLVAPTTPGDGEWYATPVGSTESPISVTVEELRLGMLLPR